MRSMDGATYFTAAVSYKCKMFMKSTTKKINRPETKKHYNKTPTLLANIRLGWKWAVATNRRSMVQ
jgi:hypothetical protein